jgi:hypothetical protein
MTKQCYTQFLTLFSTLYSSKTCLADILTVFSSDNLAAGTFAYILAMLGGEYSSAECVGNFTIVIHTLFFAHPLTSLSGSNSPRRSIATVRQIAKVLPPNRFNEKPLHYEAGLFVLALQQFLVDRRCIPGSKDGGQLVVQLSVLI